MIVRVLSNSHVSTTDDVAGVLTTAKLTAEDAQCRPSNILTCTIRPEAGQFVLPIFTEQFVLYLGMRTNERLCPSDFA